MKYVILVGDGMGDLPLPELHNKTVLEAAQTPTMDYLCRHGELLRLKTIPDGFDAGSDVANLSLLGYLPREIYTGRAPLEAASMGVQLADDEVACRCNLVNVDFRPDGRITMIDYSADHISTVEAALIIGAMQECLQTEMIRFYPGVSYRHLLVFKGKLEGLETVPPHDHLGQDVTEYWQRYQQIPQLKELLAGACSLLQDHDVNRQRIRRGLRPANAIWLWGQGRPPSMPTIYEQYGIRGALISAVDLLKGIGVYGGLDIIRVEGATGYIDTNYAGKADAALAALQDRDFVFVHVEAPDESGHQGLVAEKLRAIEDFDRKIVKPIFDGLRRKAGDAGFRLVVAMDHYTPIATRTHAAFPVPIALYDSRREEGGCGLAFTEKNSETAPVLLENGRLFFQRLLERGCSHESADD
jgi:2,3-bisphosphoglycerate-independent phosphoglycerate mutase